MSSSFGTIQEKNETAQYCTILFWCDFGKFVIVLYYTFFGVMILGSLLLSLVCYCHIYQWRSIMSSSFGTIQEKNETAQYCTILFWRDFGKFVIVLYYTFFGVVILGSLLLRFFCY
jgi:hypothetical protein